MELEAFHQEIILDHKRRPRHFRSLPGATRRVEGNNPLCGDRLTFDIDVRDGRIAAAGFQGEGCALAMASASLMTEAIQGLTVAEARSLFTRVHDLMTGECRGPGGDLGKLEALSGVCGYPARIKCASLAWQALRTALEAPEKREISTELEP